MVMDRHLLGGRGGGGYEPREALADARKSIQ